MGKMFWGVVLLFACQARVAVAQQPFMLERFEEDHSRTSPEPGETGLSGRLKHVQVGDGYVSFGGEIRERLDAYDAPGFGLGSAKDSYGLHRILLHADLHAGERVRVFLQLGMHSSSGKAKIGPSDKGGTDLQNAFVDLVADAQKRFQIRVGRQDLILNSAQRFVSVREGPNMRQSFDGASLRWSGSNLRIRGFVTKPVKYKTGRFDDSADDTQRFFGADATYSIDEANTIQVYALELDRDQVTFGGTMANERRRSLGGRWAGKHGQFDHDVEALHQGGTFGDRAIRAWALAASAGYTLRQAWSPRLGLEYDAGSGDGDPNDGRLGTFNPMFPKGPFFDPSSLNSWANLRLARASFSVAPSKALSLSFSVSQRWRQSTSDAVYIQPYVPLAATLGNPARRVGEEYEFNLSWQTNRHLVVLFQALHASAGPAIRLAGGRPVNFAMVTTQLRF